MSTLELNAQKTALVLIDLQNGIVSNPDVAPFSAAEVMSRASQLAAAFRANGATVVYVHVDMSHLLQLPVDSPMRAPGAPPPPATASDFAAQSGRLPDDLVISKRHWGAFAGTALEQELRQRGVETVVIGGISTNQGVESTVRQGTGLGFAFVVAEDVCTSTMGAEAHQFAIEKIFPRLARVRKTDEVLAGLS